ncbi:Methyltransferase domain-containing protein [Actinokineospora alba]|uniref:Methyltransferase domain-containing protein n=1 Tax=Actinokineospora alba TaxID=504798 RepID=A0A1H0VSH8_9PSEU|nr:class I SAM-dependent methyltransferase [Actinokineospora alba]TDP70119.1 methyltransferase family protein [Actinokineospora alba]SDI38660.1 Methyltransferase domain-containing protein [Actinokineospora alba]SDP81400.1 Methyltransferase domain-containing protein [Actinokineospora alba]
MGVRTALRKMLASQLGNPRGLMGKSVAKRLNKFNFAATSGAVEALAVVDGEVVADLGFGGGVGLRLLLDTKASEVHGVDYSASMVDRARREFHDDRLRLATGSITALPLPDDSVDGLITLNTIYFIEDLATAFAEIGRVLRPGGRAVIGIGDPEGMAKMPVTQHGFIVRPVEDVVATLAGAGLVLTDHRRVSESELAPHLLVVCHAK